MSSVEPKASPVISYIHICLYRSHLPKNENNAFVSVTIFVFFCFFLATGFELRGFEPNTIHQPPPSFQYFLSFCSYDSFHSPNFPSLSFSYYSPFNFQDFLSNVIVSG